jgi:hypothetical protein
LKTQFMKNNLFSFPFFFSFLFSFLSFHLSFLYNRTARALSHLPISLYHSVSDGRRSRAGQGGATRGGRGRRAAGSARGEASARRAGRHVVKRRARSGAAGAAATSASPRLIRCRRDRRVAATASRAGHPRRHRQHPCQLLLAQHLHALWRHCGCGGGSSIGSPFPPLRAK